MKGHCDALHRGCLKVFNEKKAAIERGDETLLQMVGEGKDVMSVLRTSLVHLGAFSEIWNFL